MEEKIKFERMLGNVRENSLFQADSSSPSSQFSSPKSVSFLCGIVGCCHTVAAAAELYEWNVLSENLELSPERVDSYLVQQIIAISPSI